MKFTKFTEFTLPARRHIVLAPKGAPRRATVAGSYARASQKRGCGVYTLTYLGLENANPGLGGSDTRDPGMAGGGVATCLRIPGTPRLLSWLD